MFSHLPKSEKYIFQGSQPGSISEERPTGANVKKSKHEFIHRMLDQEPIVTTGGTVRVADSLNFPLSKTIAAALVTINPGAIREMHWHPIADEWSFFLKGRARVTIFASEGTARTFNFEEGDVGIVPKNHGHYVENIGDEPIEMLEVFRADQFRDISLSQWLAGSPPRQVADTLFADDPENGEKFWNTIKDLPKDEITKP